MDQAVTSHFHHFRSVQELNPQIRCIPIYGGESLMKQHREIRSRGVDIVCATPGRLKDHLERGILVSISNDFLRLLKKLNETA